MDEAGFWSSTVAQLAALLPPTPKPAEPERGDGADLLALAGMG